MNSEFRMNITFREQATFSRDREEQFGNDEGFRRFQEMLLQNPRRGDVIPGTSGIRKARWVDPARGMGKRGGIRVIYLYVEEYSTILLLLVYDKNIPDLTPQQKKALAAIVKAFYDELAAEGDIG
jgi:mRNA-degrading endonuclease RelE of RelBE toxin-antitoxin system